jgi:hypothetical protein
MLGLQFRAEIKGRRLKGTAFELTDDNNTGATQTQISLRRAPVAGRAAEARDPAPRGDAVHDQARAEAGWSRGHGAALQQDRTARSRVGLVEKKSGLILSARGARGLKRDAPSLPVSRQCVLAGVSHSCVYALRAASSTKGRRCGFA